MYPKKPFIAKLEVWATTERLKDSLFVRLLITVFSRGEK
jgi:hypothetical protein